MRSFPGVVGQFRKPFGPGWALVGDAGDFKDRYAAHGITDAFRDAELLTAAVLCRDFAGYEATALVHKLTMVTRTVADFTRFSRDRSSAIADVVAELSRPRLASRFPASEGSSSATAASDFRGARFCPGFCATPSLWSEVLIRAAVPKDSVELRSREMVASV